MSELEWLETFGDNLRGLMEERGYSQERLAHETGLSKGTISRYVNKQRVPTIRALNNICYVLNCSMDELANFDELVY